MTLIKTTKTTIPEIGIIVDASAIIALLNQEKGYEIVNSYLEGSIVSAVNFSEILTVINREKIFSDENSEKEGIKLLKNSFTNIINFDDEQAYIAASIDKFTKKYGLSFGDRACLALAQCKNLPVLTADRIWKKLKIGVDVKLIR